MKSVRLKEASLIVIATVIMFTAVFYVGYKLFNPKDDSVVEEAIEEVIEDLTGIEDIDLTPTTPEH